MRKENKMEKDNALMVTVDAARLSQSLKTVFLGVAGVFGSLDGKPNDLTQVEQAARAVVASVTESTPSAEQESVAPPQDKPTNEATPNNTPPMHEELQPELEAGTAVTTLTIDDITRTVSKKIQANRKNTEKIGKLVKAYGLESLKQLPPEKYEAFMTDLAQI